MFGDMKINVFLQPFLKEGSWLLSIGNMKKMNKNECLRALPM